MSVGPTPALATRTANPALPRRRAQPQRRIRPQPQRPSLLGLEAAQFPAAASAMSPVPPREGDPGAIPHLACRDGVTAHRYCDVIGAATSATSLLQAEARRQEAEDGRGVSGLEGGA